MEWDDIQKFSSWGKYTTDVSWHDLENTLQRYEKESDLDLNPDFQRGHVWSKQQQIKYVEYILKRGNSSRNIIFNCPGWMEGFEGQMVLIDGKQRLNAARLFMLNELPVFDGVYRKDFKREGKEIMRFPQAIHFTFYVNDLQTRAEILQFYLDLNTGGVVHSDSEIDRVRQLLSIENSKQS